jgi:hypothetical protein
VALLWYGSIEGDVPLTIALRHFTLLVGLLPAWQLHVVGCGQRTQASNQVLVTCLLTSVVQLLARVMIL